MGRLYVAAALVVLVYIPLSVPVKLFLWMFVKPLRREELRGKVVLITGASSGIGEELAYQYARKGAFLALVARRKQALKTVAAAARERGAPDVLVLDADVSDAGQSRRAVEETIAHYGKLNHLVANAGIWSTCPFDEITNITAFTTIMDVNFWGAVYPDLLRAAAPQGEQGKARRLLLRGRNGGHLKDELLQRVQSGGAEVLRDTESGARLGGRRHHPHPRLRRVRDDHGQGCPERRSSRRRRGGQRRADRGVPGGQRGRHVQGRRGRHPEGRPVRDVAVHVPAAAAGRVPRARDRELAVLRDVQHQDGRRPAGAAQQEGPRRHRHEAVLPGGAPAQPGRHQDGRGVRRRRRRRRI